MRKSFSCAFLNFLTLFSLLLLTACEKDRLYESTYIYGVFAILGDSPAFAFFDDYLALKGISGGVTWTTRTFKSETKSENDQKAIALFNEQIAKIDEEELKELFKGENIAFVYGVEISPYGWPGSRLASKIYQFGSYAQSMSE